MHKFIAKVIVLLSILANFVLFIVTVVSLIFVSLSTNAIQEFTYAINNPITWAGTIFSLTTVVYTLVISIVALVDLIKGKDMRNVSYNYCALLPIMITAGITVFVFCTLKDVYFDFYCGIYIATVILNLILFALSLLINKKRL